MNLHIMKVKNLLLFFCGMLMSFQTVLAQWTTSGSNVYLTTTTSNVAIGTITPVEKFSIESNGLWQIRIKEQTTGGTDWRIGSSANAWAAGGGKFLISNANASTSAAFAINSAGKVGIGTVNPNYNLDVNGIINASSIYINGAPFAGGGSQWTTSSSNIYFSSGNVGIGTTQPGSFKLAVEGKIGAREVVVTLSNPWPDYVFAPSFKLPSLLEVEHFIKVNSHLPGVPSANEIKQDGLPVGEMNAILLKKIEELTLYVIELEKKNKEQDKVIEELVKEKKN